jgi:hypothetical protein
VEAGTTAPPAPSAAGGRPSEEILTVPIVDAPHSGPLPPEPVTEAVFQSQLLGTCPACKFQSCKWQRHRNGSMWYRCCRFPECE